MAKEPFINMGYHESVDQQRREMRERLEAFLQSYYDLLEESGGPIRDHDPREEIEEGLTEVEKRWLATLKPGEDEDAA